MGFWQTILKYKEELGVIGDVITIGTLILAILGIVFRKSIFVYFKGVRMFLVEAYRITKRRMAYMARLEKLDPQEEAILRHYYDLKRNTLPNGSRIPEILNLERDNILVCLNAPEEKRQNFGALWALNSEAIDLVYEHFKKSDKAKQKEIAKLAGL